MAINRGTTVKATARRVGTHIERINPGTGGTTIKATENPKEPQQVEMKRYRLLREGFHDGAMRPRGYEVTSAQPAEHLEEIVEPAPAAKPPAPKRATKPAAKVVAKPAAKPVAKPTAAKGKARK